MQNTFSNFHVLNFSHHSHWVKIKLQGKGPYLGLKISWNYRGHLKLVLGKSDKCVSGQETKVTPIKWCKNGNHIDFLYGLSDHLYMSLSCQCYRL